MPLLFSVVRLKVSIDSSWPSRSLLPRETGKYDHDTLGPFPPIWPQSGPPSSASRTWSLSPWSGMVQGRKAYPANLRWNPFSGDVPLVDVKGIETLLLFLPLVLAFRNEL